MALTLNELYNEIRPRYQLSLLAAKDHLEHAVYWTHTVESPEFLQHFWGNELVVTSGFACKNEEDLLKLITAIGDAGCCGVVINVGKYVETIPDSVIRYCNEQNLPLFSMPWEIHISDFVKYCCRRIDQESQDMEELCDAVIHAIRSPDDTSEYSAILKDYFDESAGFQLMNIFVDVPETARRLGIHIAELRFHTALNRWGFQYLVFPYNTRFIIVMNQTDQKITKQIANHIVETYHETVVRYGESLNINVGVGVPVPDLEGLSTSFQAAQAAVRRAQLTRQDIVCFEDMQFYQLLYTIPNANTMQGYYEHTLRPLLEHDRKHNSCFIETLFRYVLHNGSLQAVADEMYTHRNTVNYRMGRIRELLDCPLSTHTDCLPYLLAYHIGVALKLIDDYGIEGSSPDGL